MSILLNIDTSIETASVSIAKDGLIMFSITNAIQKEHASFLHTAIKELLTELSLDLKQIDAIAVTNGPGSYTGLRVGMASAKGLCFALNKPLITIGTLNGLAMAVINEQTGKATPSILYCPMIDARRMEVYTAVFNESMNEILPASAMILQENSFEELLKENTVIFFGNGAIKWKQIAKSHNAVFMNELDTTAAIAKLSFNKFQHNIFSDLSYSEPLYVKEFFSP